MSDDDRPISMDPRVERTRALVLHHARLLLAEYGYGGFTYAALSARARVTRQTIYRHWPTREVLLRDMLLEGPFIEHFVKFQSPAPGKNARPIVRDFLLGLRAGVELPEIAGPLALLISDAEHDEGARDTLRSVSTDRVDYLNGMLEPSGVVVDLDEVSTLMGALLARRFIQHVPIEDDYIDFLVENWWTARTARQRKAARDSK
jgi:AcrR family transcriptional regulator